MKQNFSETSHRTAGDGKGPSLFLNNTLTSCGQLPSHDEILIELMNCILIADTILIVIIFNLINWISTWTDYRTGITNATNDHVS